MTAFGAVAHQPSDRYSKTTRVWTDATKVIRSTSRSTATFASGVKSSVVSGLVFEGSTPVTRLVRVYRRDTGELLGTTNSVAGSGGSFSMQLNGYTGKVYVIAFDDITSAPDYNAQIYDLVVPA